MVALSRIVVTSFTFKVQFDNMALARHSVLALIGFAIRFVQIHLKFSISNIP